MFRPTGYMIPALALLVLAQAVACARKEFRAESRPKPVERAADATAPVDVTDQESDPLPPIPASEPEVTDRNPPVNSADAPPSPASPALPAPPATVPVDGMNDDTASPMEERFLTRRTPVDLILSIDDSPSMNKEKDYLQNGVSRLLRELSSHNLDMRIHVIARDFSPPFDPAIRVYDYDIGSHDTISVVNQFLGAQQPLRPGAHLVLVIFSDDNGEGAGNRATDFRTPVGVAGATVSAVVGMSEGRSKINDECRIAEVGTEYLDLAGQTGGHSYDLCTPDWDQLLGMLTDDIVDDVRRYPLRFPPDPARPITVRAGSRAIGPGDYVIEGREFRLREGFTLENGTMIAISYIPKL